MTEEEERLRLDNYPLNVIISGLGGQGVLTLNKVITNLCKLYNVKLQSSAFKGGAQKHGSIHCVLRLFKNKNKNYDLYSTQVPEGELDLMIGLEPWETLRYQKYFGAKTRIFVNEKIVPFHIERHNSLDHKNPNKIIQSLKLETVSKNYSEESKKVFGTQKMANFLVGLEVIKYKIIQFDLMDYIHIFCQLIKTDKDKVIRSLQDKKNEIELYYSPPLKMELNRCK